MPTDTENEIETEVAECLVISAPRWFERQDFLRWLRDRENAVATWDRGGESTEYADCFLNFDGGVPLPGEERFYEGSDFNGAGENALPADIEEEIKRALAERGLRWGVVWIKPV